ncbi:hypothetical protein HI914_05866 [Erysiphe necator]|nr:hypothetical protein HI914_05866 [Erysiphe necator]
MATCASFDRPFLGRSMNVGACQRTHAKSNSIELDTILDALIFMNENLVTIFAKNLGNSRCKA